MKNNIVKFPTNFKGDDKGTWLAGYAAGLADAARNGADIEQLLSDSGLTAEEFYDAGADEYDMEDLKGKFPQDR